MELLRRGRLGLFFHVLENDAKSLNTERGRNIPQL